MKTAVMTPVTSLYHQPTPDLAVEDGEGLTLKLFAGSGKAGIRAWVRTAPDNEEVLTPMAVADAQYTGPFELTCLVVTIPLDAIHPHTAYVFKVQIADGPMQWLAADGVRHRMPPQEVQFKWAHSGPPEWVRQQIFYQIFPDRFCNGDDSLNLQDRAFKYLGQRDARTREWDEAPDKLDGPNEFYNGDLPGVSRSLSYLQDTLGVTALYLNPVFRSDSNHKYDTIDYFQVDPALGGNKALQALRDHTRERGMRLMLDGVLNHTSVMHEWFIRAQSGEAPFTDYYLDAQGDYASWKGHKSLPVLDYSNPDVVTECYQGEQSVLRHWLRPPYAIDGWRLDVIHMLGEGVGARNNSRHVAAMRQVIKEENPEGYFLGEHFFEATQWLQGDQEDAAMNYYGFMHPVWLFLAGTDLNRDPGYISAIDFAAWLREARAKIPFAMAQCQFNLLDSHDTPRLLTLLHGNEKRFVMAVRLQMVYLGVPCIYYGDEVGLEGREDPENRRTFPWDKTHWNRHILHACQEAIGWRHDYSVLTEGGVVDLEAGDDYWVFARVSQDGAALVGVNRGSDALTLKIALTGLPVSGEHWQPVGEQSPLHLDNGQLTMHLPAESTELWVLQ